MAGLFLDGWDHYATADLLTKWNTQITGGAAGSVSIQSAAGRNGTGAFRLGYLGGGNSTGPNLGSRTLSVSGATAILGAAITVSSLTSASKLGIFEVVDGTTVQVSVKINSDGTFTVLRGDVSTGTVLGTSSTALSAGTYGYLELKTLIDPTVGTYELRLNNASILTGTGANTRNSAASQWTRVGLGKSGGNTPGATCNMDFDDFYVCDGSGGVNADFLGDGRVIMKLPNTGNGTNAAWTPSTGTDHGALVDENPPNTSDYNSSNTPGQRDTYTYPTLGVTGVVKMVQPCLYCFKSDAGARSVAPVHYISAVNYDGTTVNPSTSASYLLQVYDQSPASGTTWTTTEINAMETGIKLVA